MKRNSKLVAVLVAGAMVAGLAAGCGSSAKSGSASSAVSAVSSAESSGELQDGVYSAKFTSDSSMFHVNEACNGLGKLTVKDGKMVIHIALASENIVNLFEGTAEDAQKEGAELIQPTVDTINYSDGTTEEVYGFDVPVPATCRIRHGFLCDERSFCRVRNDGDERGSGGSRQGGSPDRRDLRAGENR